MGQYAAPRRLHVWPLAGRPETHWSQGRCLAKLFCWRESQDVFARNEHGATALHYSSVEGCLDVSKALLEVAEQTGSVDKLVSLGQHGVIVVGLLGLELSAMRS